MVYGVVREAQVRLEFIRHYRLPNRGMAATGRYEH